MLILIELRLQTH